MLSIVDARPLAHSPALCPALLVPDVWPGLEATIAGSDGRSERLFLAESSVLIAHRRIARRKSGLTGRQGNGTSSTSLHRHQTLGLEVEHARLQPLRPDFETHRHYRRIYCALQARFTVASNKEVRWQEAEATLEPY